MCFDVQAYPGCSPGASAHKVTHHPFQSNSLGLWSCKFGSKFLVNWFFFYYFSFCYFNLANIKTEFLFVFFFKFSTITVNLEMTLNQHSNPDCTGSFWLSWTESPVLPDLKRYIWIQQQHWSRWKSHHIDKQRSIFFCIRQVSERSLRRCAGWYIVEMLFMAFRCPSCHWHNKYLCDKQTDSVTTSQAQRRVFHYGLHWRSAIYTSMPHHLASALTVFMVSHPTSLSCLSRNVSVTIKHRGLHHCHHG